MDLLRSERWNSARGLAFGADIFAHAAGCSGPRRRVLASISRHIDTVVKVGKTFCQVGGCLEALCESWHSITGLRDSADAGDRPYPTGGTWGEAWWKALLLTTGGTDERKNDILGFELLDFLNPGWFFGYLPKGKISKGCQELLESQGPDFMFHETIKPFVNGPNVNLQTNCLFVTQHGYLGFARGGIREGDGIFLLGGCYAPLVLRETGEVVSETGTMFGNGNETRDLKGEPLRELISGAYIYGAMDGELVSGETAMVCLV